MKFIRAELHNHSTESDGALSVESLAAYAAKLVRPLTGRP